MSHTTITSERLAFQNGEREPAKEKSQAFALRKRQPHLKHASVHFKLHNVTLPQTYEQTVY